MMCRGFLGTTAATPPAVRNLMAEPSLPRHRESRRPAADHLTVGPERTRRPGGNRRGNRNGIASFDEHGPTADPALAEVFRRQREYTDEVQRRTGQIIPLVFHKEGRQIGSYHKAWHSACRPPM